MKSLTWAMVIATMLFLSSAPAQAAQAAQAPPGVPVPTFFVQAPASLQDLHLAINSLNAAEAAELNSIFWKMDKEICSTLDSHNTWGYCSVPTDPTWATVNGFHGETFCTLDTGRELQCQQYKAMRAARIPLMLGDRSSKWELHGVMAGVSQKLHLTAEQQFAIEPVLKTYFEQAAETVATFERQKSDITVAYLDYQFRVREATEYNK